MTDILIICSEIESLVEMCDRFKVDSFKNECTEMLANRVNSDTVQQYAQFAKKYKLTNLQVNMQASIHALTSLEKLN